MKLQADYDLEEARKAAQSELNKVENIAAQYAIPCLDRQIAAGGALQICYTCTRQKPV